MNDWITPTGVRVSWAVDSSGMVTAVEVSHAVSAAYDILTDAGYSPEKAAKVVILAERQGTDPVWFARKMVRLRNALSQPG